LTRIRADLLAARALEPDDIRGPVAEPSADAVHDPRFDDLLGPRPDDRRMRPLWDRAAVLIAGYRTRWNLTDADDLLGALPPTGTPQAADRASLNRQLECLERLMERHRVERAGFDRGEDDARGR
jgi:hypothetical protein